MKTFTKIFFIIIIFYSCDNDESINISDQVDDKLIEEYTYDPYGVIFKITNDINYAFDLNFDSVAFAKFQYNPTLGDARVDMYNIDHFTWIPYGYYVNWQYNYTGQKFVTIITNISEEDYIINAALKTYSCNPSEVNNEWFQSIFPYPVNDTVYVSISKLIDDIINSK